MTLNKQRGFTIIELVVVISIIGILITISIIAFNASRSKARDAIRLTDIQQLSIALEYYYDNNKRTYPECGYVCDFNTNWQSGCLGEALKPYITTLPRDPLKKSSGGYCYSSHYHYNVGNKQDVFLTFFMEDANLNFGNAIFRFWENNSYYFSLAIKEY